MKLPNYAHMYDDYFFGILKKDTLGIISFYQGEIQAKTAEGLPNIQEQPTVYHTGLSTRITAWKSSGTVPV